MSSTPSRPASSGELIGRVGHTLVWGGSDTGLMKVVTDGVWASRGRLTGISIDSLRKWVRKDADEMTFARDLAERKARLLAVSDAVW
jgi:predicted Rossmann-fold nucleotide-binding protein